MNVPQAFLDMVSKDIERLSNVSNLSEEKLLTLHREIDGRYQACIKNWYIGLWRAPHYFMVNCMTILPKSFKIFR